MIDLKARKIGSSDAPAIMRVSPWDTPFTLWERKINKTERVQNSAMKRGTEMEDTARKCFQKKMGVIVSAKPMQHPTFDFMTANLDGIDIDGKIAVEIKCPNKDDHFAAVGKQIPTKYFPQVQHQMAVAGLDGMYYFSFDGTDGVIVEVARDDKYLESLIEEERKFWQCIQTITAPELTEQDFIRLENSTHLDRARTAFEANGQIKHWEKVYKEALSDLKIYSEDRNAIFGDFKLRKGQRRGSIDYDQIEILRDLNLDQYRKSPTTVWTLSKNK